MAHYGCFIECNPAKYLFQPPPFHWDLSMNVYMARNKRHQDLLPCITKHHTLWNVKRMRPWLGVELLLVQGFHASPDDRIVTDFFPNDPNISDRVKRVLSTSFKSKSNRTYVTDHELREMAGNTMTVGAMGILQAWVEIS